MGYVVIRIIPSYDDWTKYCSCAQILHWDKKNNRVKELLSLVQLNPAEYIESLSSTIIWGPTTTRRSGKSFSRLIHRMYYLMNVLALNVLTRMELQREVKKFHESLAEDFIFVTHDINEALFLGHMAHA